MDAARYFEMMHRAMSSQNRSEELLFRADVQDLGGADAALELRRNAAGQVHVLTSTMGRRSLNFQLFRKGWQSCHNASGELTGQFPASADALLTEEDLAAYIRTDLLDAGRAARILAELSRLSDGYAAPLSPASRQGALITAESRVGTGAHWCYWSTDAAAPLPLAAILCWLGDFLAGAERRTLQSCPEAIQLATRWQTELASPPARPAVPAQPPVSPDAPARCAARFQPVQNPRWQSILAVLATV